jgi:hypothetical protein
MEHEDEDEYKDKERRRLYYSRRRDDRSPSQSRSSSGSPARPSSVKSGREHIANFLKYQKKLRPIKPQFEDLCDSFYAQLLSAYNSGALINYDLIKTEIYNFYLEYATTNATAIVKDLLQRLPKSNHSSLLKAKARGFLRNNDFADINVKLADKDVEDLMGKIYNIFENELQKQQDEKKTEALSEMFASSSIGTERHSIGTERQTEALSKMLASVNIGNKAKGNKTYRRKKNTYNSRNKKPKNNKPKNKKTYRKKKQ